MVWPAGIPALAMLVFLTAACFLLVPRAAKAMVPLGGTAETEGRRRVMSHALTVGIVAALYWVWALRHVADGDPDLGVLSFAIAFAGAVRGFLAAQPSDARHVKHHGIFSALACILVCLNYCLGTVFVVLRNMPWTLAVYFVVSAAWWVCAASYGAFAAHMLLQTQMEIQTVSVHAGELQVLHGQPTETPVS
eukprot:NODE_15138_length_1066_cov_4.129925.p2 GENE.NODE_15138_length_1066_cov_4.129925~~NODE_15138_length_1066_cov_4.129925.p2  ORF type:complete len:217 (-),score=43.53 NODE_15138_length_1066_cov_4.129925:416-991(-)